MIGAFGIQLFRGCFNCSVRGIHPRKMGLAIQKKAMTCKGMQSSSRSHHILRHHLKLSQDTPGFAPSFDFFIYTILSQNPFAKCCRAHTRGPHRGPTPFRDRLNDDLSLRHLRAELKSLQRSQQWVHLPPTLMEVENPTTRHGTLSDAFSTTSSLSMSALAKIITEVE